MEHHGITAASWVNHCKTGGSGIRTGSLMRRHRHVHQPIRIAAAAARCCCGWLHTDRTCCSSDMPSSSALVLRCASLGPAPDKQHQRGLALANIHLDDMTSSCRMFASSSASHAQSRSTPDTPCVAASGCWLSAVLCVCTAGSGMQLRQLSG
jgi:hypothetical protein